MNEYRLFRLWLTNILLSIVIAIDFYQEAGGLFTLDQFNWTGRDPSLHPLAESSQDKRWRKIMVFKSVTFAWSMIKANWVPSWMVFVYFRSGDDIWRAFLEGRRTRSTSSNSTMRRRVEHIFEFHVYTKGKAISWIPTNFMTIYSYAVRDVSGNEVFGIQQNRFNSISSSRDPDAVTKLLHGWTWSWTWFRWRMSPKHDLSSQGSKWHLTECTLGKRIVTLSIMLLTMPLMTSTARLQAMVRKCMHPWPPWPRYRRYHRESHDISPNPDHSLCFAAPQSTFYISHEKRSCQIPTLCSSSTICNWWHLLRGYRLEATDRKYMHPRSPLRLHCTYHKRKK